MSPCALSPDRLARLQAGQLAADEAAALRDHFGQDCAECEKQLDAAGLDEETLLLQLFAADAPEPSTSSLERIWQGVREQGRERPSQKVADEPSHPVARGLSSRLFGTSSVRPAWSWGLGGLVVAGAAATLLVVTVPRQLQQDPDPGIKGSAPLPAATLTLVPATGTRPPSEIFELRYGLEREANVVLLHARRDHSPEILFVGSLRAAAPGEGTVVTPGGMLAYDFAGEPGPHLFVLAVSETAADAHAIVRLVGPAWLEAPATTLAVKIGEVDVVMTMMRRVAGGEK
jgi:hypothetical protein